MSKDHYRMLCYSGNIHVMTLIERDIYAEIGGNCHDIRLEATVLEQDIY